MFEYTIYLWALPLLSLPFFIKFIRPTKPEKVLFSQMYLLYQVLKDTLPVKKDNPWWLYLIRILALLSLIFMIVGILIPRGQFSPEKSVLYICDDTIYSMAKKRDSKQIWELFKETVFSSSKNFSASTNSAWLGLSGRFINWNNINTNLNLIELTNASYQKTNWPLFYKNFQNLINTRPDENLKIFFISQGKYEEPKHIEQWIKNIPSNLSFKKIDLNSTFLSNGTIKAHLSKNIEGITIHGQIHYPSLSKIELKLESINGQTKSKWIQLNNGSANFNWKISNQNFYSSKLSLNIDDKYDFDNYFFYSLKNVDHYPIVYLDHQQASQRLKDTSYYIKKGFYALSKEYPIQFTAKAPGNWDVLKKFSKGLIILHDPPFLSENEQSILIEKAKKGTHILILPGPMTPVQLFDRGPLKKFLPAKLKEISNQDHHFILDEEWRKNCPKFSNITSHGKWLFYRLKPDSKIKYQYKDASPFWVSSKIGKGNIHLISSPFHIIWSEAVLLSDFPYVLRELLNSIDRSWIHTNKYSLKAGYPFPRQITSMRKILTLDHKSKEVVPGIYEFGLKENLIKWEVCNLQSDLLQERYSLNSTSKVNSSSYNRVNSLKTFRIDFLFVILVLILFGTEAIVLRKKLN